MAFITGSAASMSDVLTAIQNACTSNGWTLSGSVLYKGACYARLTVSSGTRLDLLGGNGIDGSNNLTTPGGQVVSIGAGLIGGISGTVAYPVTYYIFVNSNPDEVYVFINYGTSYYQWLAFGNSSAYPITGSGNWYAATSWPGSGGWTGISLTPTSGGRGSMWESCGALFMWSSGGGNGYFHHNLDSLGWGGGSTASAVWSAQPLYSINSNQWNGQSLLLPIHVTCLRASSKSSIVGTLTHSRYIRIPNYSPLDIIVLGSDRWMVFPWLSKNAAAPNGGNSIQDSGTMGVALRYDGP